jgi:uncharacterized protein (DUF849 family)
LAVNLQACLNGGRLRSEHPAVPVSAAELALDASACVAAGADSFHVHVRGADARETLDPATVDETVIVIRAACALPVGVSTAAWIEPDPAKRVALVAQWTAPDYASVNLYEEGFADVMRALLDRGIGIEAGLESVDDVERLVASGLAPDLLRVLVEVVDEQPDVAARHALAIDAALDRAGISTPRLHHGEGPATWAVLQQGYATGRDGRVGLEDVLTLPDGSVAPGNAALVRAAAGIRAAATRLEGADNRPNQ